MSTTRHWRQMKVARTTVARSDDVARTIVANGWTLLVEHCTYAGDDVRLVFGRQDRFTLGS